MRIVLDTNVLVSGLINPLGPPGQILTLFLDNQFTLLTDSRIVLEYKRVLSSHHLPFSQSTAQKLIEFVSQEGESISAAPISQRLVDPDDEAFLEVALSGKADFLITGNLKHFPTNSNWDVKIVSPREFIEIFRKVTNPD